MKKKGRKPKETESNYMLRKRLLKTSKREMIKYFLEENRKYKTKIKQLERSVFNKISVIRNYKTRLKKVEAMVKSMIEHPYARE